MMERAGKMKLDDSNLGETLATSLEKAARSRDETRRKARNYKEREARANDAAIDLRLKIEAEKLRLAETDRLVEVLRSQQEELAQKNTEMAEAERAARDREESARNDVTEALLGQAANVHMAYKKLDATVEGTATPALTRLKNVIERLDLAFSDAFVVGKNLIEEARSKAADEQHRVSSLHLDTLNSALDFSRQYLIDELSKKAAMYQSIVILDKELKMILDHIDPVQPQDLVQP